MIETKNYFVKIFHLPFWPTGFFIYRPSKIKKKKNCRELNANVNHRWKFETELELDFDWTPGWCGSGMARTDDMPIAFLISEATDWLRTDDLHQRHIYVFLPFFNDNFAFLANPSYFSQLEIKMIYIYICNDSHSSFLFLDSTIICVI